MSYQSTYAVWEAAKKEQLHQQTWGHLAPEKNVTYRGKILFCISEYNSSGITLIKDTLPNSPWMYDSILDFIDTFKLDVGVYEINVTFRNYRFWGVPNQKL